MLRFLCAGIFICQTIAAESLRVATYNLNNYLVMDRHVGTGWRPDYPKPENEKHIIRQVIKQAAPDILALQEIGSVSFLEELRADLAMEGVDYPYAFHLEAYDKNRQIALLSNLNPQNVVKHTDLDFKYNGRREPVKRGMLEVAFVQPNGATFKLFLVHLKSQYTKDKTDPEARLRRTREAEACRDRIIERTFGLKQDAFMIFGDFNDHPSSAPLRRFYKRGSLKIASLLPATDSRDELWTYYYQKEATYSLFDVILFSEGISNWIRAGSGTIVDMPGMLAGSDHRMVFVDLLSVERCQQNKNN